MVTIINYPPLGIKIGEGNHSVINSRALSVTLLDAGYKAVNTD